MILEIVLNFFKKNRKHCFLLLLLVYLIFSLIPQEIIDSSLLVQRIVIISFSAPFCLYNFLGWKDETRDLKKRNFSRFCFFSILIIVLGNVLLWKWTVNHGA